VPKEEEEKKSKVHFTKADFFPSFFFSEFSNQKNYNSRGAQCIR